MDWIDITGPRQVCAACVSREEWLAVAKAHTDYLLADVPMLEAELCGKCAAYPGADPGPEYEARLKDARLLMTGVTWYEAAMWCNALSAELKLEPVYTLNQTTAKWVPAVSVARGKASLTELEELPGSKGVRLLTEKDRREVAEAKGFVSIAGIHEWGTERRRAPQVFESVVLGGPEGLLCNSTFRIPWHAMRVVKG